jgi:hypothetical protein
MSRKNRTPARGAPVQQRPVSQRTDDSFANFQARLGWGTDNQSSASQYTLTYQSRNRVWLEAAYRGSWIVRAAVDAIPEDMTRAGIEISGLDPTDATKLNRSMARLAVWDSLCDDGKWAQLYGGCLAVMLIDGQDLASPLRPQTVGRGQFKGLLILDRWMVAPPVGELVTELGPDLGKPMFYNVIAATAGLPQGKIHYSRVIRMDGEALPFYQRIAENGWGLSILEPMWDRLIAFDSATVGIGQLVYKAHLRVLQIEKLRDILAVGGPAEAALRKQIEFTRFAQTNEGITLLDASDVFNTHQYSFSGLDSVLIQFGHQLAGAIGTPYTRLFGESPGGLGSNGNGEMKQYHEKIKQRQERKLRNPLTRLLAVLSRSELGMPPPDDFDFEFCNLQEMSEAEKADIGSKTTESVTKAVDANLLTRSGGMKELKASTPNTGMFGTITDDDIAQAEQEEIAVPPPDASSLQVPDLSSLRTGDSFLSRFWKRR